MQFHLEREELNVLLEAVQEETGPAQALLDRLIERDMRFAVDELEDLADVLIRHIERLRDKLAAAGTSAAKAELEHKLKVLEHALDRVRECLAMV
jgi:hypothetical protein